MKFLIWAAIAALIVVWLTRGKKISSDSSGAAGSATPPSGTAEPMVQCTHCGMHIPASESVTTSSGKVFCSEEHRLQYEKS
ncbi:MAG TPA: PP0621 family protein [Noviherbaspirillum sp.]